MNVPHMSCPVVDDGLDNSDLLGDDLTPGSFALLSDGLSVRDHFALAALPECLRRCGAAVAAAAAAADAYRVADAMLDARSA